MSDKSNKYGYVGVDIPAQSFGANKGVFNPAEINDLVADNKWTTFGQLELIETQTPSEVSSVTFSNIKENEYNVHFLTGVIADSSIGTAGRGNKIQFFENSVLETAGVYQYAIQFGNTAGSFQEYRSTTSSFIYVGGNDDDILTTQFYCYLYNLGDNTKYSFTTHQCFDSFNPLGDYMSFGSGILPQASTVDGIKYFLDTSDTFTGTLSLYGIRYS